MGFFFCVGHGVETQIDEAVSACRSLFALETQHKMAMHSLNSPLRRGYTPQASRVKWIKLGDQVIPQLHQTIVTDPQPYHPRVSQGGQHNCNADECKHANQADAKETYVIGAGPDMPRPGGQKQERVSGVRCASALIQTLVSLPRKCHHIAVYPCA